MAIYLSSREPSKQDIQGIAREVRTNLEVTFSYGLQHKDTPVLADQ